MRALLSVIGSRGDVQPLVALASQLRDLGHGVRICAPPGFRDWLEGWGIPMVPMGPEVRWTGAGPSLEQRRQMLLDTVAAQFETIPDAAEDCDVVLGFGGMPFAARSVAEALGIHYVYAHYCPTALPSPHHAPAPLPGWPQSETDDNRQRWMADARRWNDICGAAINGHRAKAGLRPVDDVRGHMITDQPWLAADPVLGPWPEPGDPQVIQTGAWLVPDERPLSADLEAFLAAGDPPIYFGFGSMRLRREDLGRVVVTAARALGRRAIVSRGWADLSLEDEDDGPDCLVIGEANHQSLFRRVAAVVHHGGWGTTTTAARAGTAQVVIPQIYDQFYWAERVDHLGIGIAHQAGMPTVDSLTTALTRALAPETATRAHTVAGKIRDNGAQTAAQRLVNPNSAEPNA